MRLNVNKLGVWDEGQLFIVTVPAPALGQQPSYQVPDNMAFEPLSLFCGVGASGVVGNRSPYVLVTWNSQTIFQFAALGSSGAGANGAWLFQRQAVAEFVVSGLFYVPLPWTLWPPHANVQLAFLNLDAGDQITAMSIVGMAHPLV